jgi:hypothetical protein
VGPVAPFPSKRTGKVSPLRLGTGFGRAKAVCVMNKKTMTKNEKLIFFTVSPIV